MDDRELIAAILTAGMPTTLPILRSRAECGTGPVTDAEREAIQRAVGHVIGLYRSRFREAQGRLAGLAGYDMARQ